MGGENRAHSQEPQGPVASAAENDVVILIFCIKLSYIKSNAGSELAHKIRITQTHMAIRKTDTNTEFRPGQIVMTQGVLTYGLCGWPCKIAAVNKSRLTLERLRPRNFDSDHLTAVKYAKNIVYLADSEDEAFAFYDAAMAHAQRAEARLRELNEDIRKDGSAIVRQYITTESAQ